MNIAHLYRQVAVAALLAVMAPAAAAHPVTPPDNRVSVSYDQPQTFSEARIQRSHFVPDRSAWLGTLKTYIEKRAARDVPPGQRLDITITDVKLAGNYEPWRGPRLDDVRIVRDIYPPRIDLSFKLLDKDGTVLREGSRKLRNMAFMYSGGANDQDTLRYEKALIDRWLRKGPDAL